MRFIKACVFILFLFIWVISLGFEGLPVSLKAAPVQKAEKSAAEAFTNILELKELPASQVLQVMFYMKASLGVNCNYCHIDFVHFASDENPKKQIARRMIRMVRELNRASFDGQMAVSCNTCHRGQPRPTAPLRFAPIAGPTEDKEKSPVIQPSSTMPTVEQIFERYVEATGGRQKQENLVTLFAKGSEMSSEGWRAPLEIYEAQPNKALVTFRLQNTDWSRGFDGTVGWSHDNHGWHDLREKEVDLLQRDAALLRPAALKSLFTNLRVIGKERFHSHEAFVIEGTLRGTGDERLYFDIATGFLVGITIRTETAFGPLPEEIAIEDYREVDAIKLPFSISHFKPDFSYAYKIDEMKHNTTIDEKKFHSPAGH